MIESGWTLSTCANAHKTCDNFYKSASDIFDIIRNLEEQFSISADNPDITFGLDTTIFPIKIDGEKIVVGWDNWSGVFMMADTDKGDLIVEQIYHYLISSNR